MPSDRNSLIRLRSASIASRIRRATPCLMPGESGVHQHPGVRIQFDGGRLLGRGDLELLRLRGHFDVLDLAPYCDLNWQAESLARLRLRQLDLDLFGFGVVLPSAFHDGRT